MFVATIATDEFAHFREVTFPNKQAYCARHGHTFVGLTQRLHTRRPVPWSKIKLLEILSWQHRGQWVLWSDADSVITQLDWKAESLIEPDVDMVISKDEFGINSGTFLLHLNQRSHEFLLEIYDQIQFLFHPWWEQAAMMDLLNNGYPIRVKYVDKLLINAYPEDYRAGYSVVVHCPGVRRPNRVEDLKKHLPAAGTEVGGT